MKTSTIEKEIRRAIREIEKNKTPNKMWYTYQIISHWNAQVPYKGETSWQLFEKAVQALKELRTEVHNPEEYKIVRRFTVEEVVYG